MASSTTSSYVFAKRPGCNFPNGHVQLANRCVIQQLHVDHKIANALLKKGTNAYKAWNQQDLVDMHLHESHDEGGLGVPNNTITRHAASYDQRQDCCLPWHPARPGCWEMTKS